MSASFLTTTVAGMKVEVSVAWGADLTDLDGSSWTWSDITADVVLGGQAHNASSGIEITIGRPDFSSETQTAVMTCQLDNRSSAYSDGGMSSNWPNVRRGTPVRARVSDDNGATWSVRFQGQANGFTPQWDAGTGRWATVELSASGPLRRLNQGTLNAFSAMRTGTMADPTVKAYWPMEEEQQSTQLMPAVGTGVGVFKSRVGTEPTRPGVPGTFASYSNVPSSAPFLTLAQGGTAVLAVTPTTTGTSSTTSIILGNPAGSPFQAPPSPPQQEFLLGALFSVYTPNGSRIKRWDVQYLGRFDNWYVNDSSYANGFIYEPGPLVAVRGFDVSDGVMIGWTNPGWPQGSMQFSGWDVGSTYKLDHLIENTDYEVGLTLTQSGTTTTYTLWVNPCAPIAGLARQQFSGTVSSNSNGAQVSQLALGSFDDMPGLGVGHAAVRTPAMTAWADETWMRGYPGETVVARLGRLCALNGIDMGVLDSTVAESSTSIADNMGPQYYDTLTALLRECEYTGAGLLYDGLGPGLTYVTKKRRQANANGPASLVIDAAAAQMMEPFAPVDDDQLTINHCDVSRRNATAGSYIDRTGPMGTDAIGDYATSYTANPAGDDGLVHYAEWTVGVGTQVGYRYPSVSFALETNPALIDGWLACLPQSRIDVINVTAIRRQHPSETIKLLLEGWQETIDAFTWRVTANTSSAVPWNVAKLAAATGSTGDGVCHMDTDGSQLNANAAAAATSVAVKTISGPLWVTTAVDADSFPFDLDIGGCKVTVTAIGAATSSVQTFTLASPGLPRAFTGSTTNGAGTPVKVWRPPVFGL